jgi:hypothetical protein
VKGRRKEGNKEEKEEGSEGRKKKRKKERKIKINNIIFKIGNRLKYTF